MPEIRGFDRPPKDALDFFRAKGLKPGFSHLDVWREEHALAFTVAKAMQLDLLETIRAAVDQALAEGETYQQFRKRLTPLLQEAGWWGIKEMVDPLTGQKKLVELGSPRRLKTIYQTNLRSARAAGQWQRIQRTQQSHPYLLYQLGPSREHRLEHVRWHGLLLPADDPFWQTHMPPNGWGCKCHVRQVSRREYQRLVERGTSAPAPAQILDDQGRPTGHIEQKRTPVQTTAPPVMTREWVNHRTGEVLQVPVGIDPGFDYNPGATRAAQLQTQLKAKRERAEKALKTTLPERVWPAKADPPVLSTVKGVDRHGIERVLREVPNAVAQVERLAQFLDAHPIKALVLKVSEMGGKRTAVSQIHDRIGQFLGLTGYIKHLYTIRNPARINGFTFRRQEFVIVKAAVGDNLRKVDPAQHAAAVDAAVQSAQDGKQKWSIRAAFDDLTAKRQPGLVATFIHELGHQVHFWAGAPKRPAGLPSLTQYGDDPDVEWHAEHFAAWLFNRQALAAWNQDVADYFDRLIDQAIKATQK